MQIAKCGLSVMVFAFIHIAAPLLSGADDPTSRKNSQKGSVKTLAEVEIPRNGSDLITVPISLKTGAYQFMLNMASPTTAYDVALRDQLGEPVGKRETRGLQAGTTINAEYFEAPSARIWDFPLKTRHAVGCVDLKPLRLYQRLPVYGVLGMDALRNHVIRLDFDRGKLTILSKAPPNSGRKVPIRYTPDGLPTIPVTLPGKKVTHCLLGTTLYTTILFHPERFDGLTKQRRLLVADRTRRFPSIFGTWYKKSRRLERFTGNRSREG